MRQYKYLYIQRDLANFWLIKVFSSVIILLVENISLLKINKWISPFSATKVPTRAVEWSRALVSGSEDRIWAQATQVRILAGPTLFAF